MIDSFKLIWCEIVDIEPIVIPWDCLGIFHLLFKFFIGELGVVADVYVVTALYDGLALAEDGEITVETISDSKLLAGTDYVKKFAVPYEDTGLAGPDEDIAILAFVYIHACSGVKEKDVALLAIGYLKLLHLKLPGLAELALKPAILEEEIFTFQFLFGVHDDSY
jgi:hypothetical protein